MMLLERLMLKKRMVLLVDVEQYRVPIIKAVVNV